MILLHLIEITEKYFIVQIVQNRKYSEKILNDEDCKKRYIIKFKERKAKRKFIAENN